MTDIPTIAEEIIRLSKEMQEKIRECQRIIERMK